MALLRRGIVGILRSHRQLAADRTITTAAIQAPWLMMEPVPAWDDSASTFRFWCCENETELSYESEIRKRRRIIDLMEWANSAKLVGSSQGRLAYKFKRRIHLVDPTTFHCTRLPKLVDFLQRNVRRVVLSESGKAFMICGVGSLAFCSENEWRIFSERDVEYESIVYSSADRRLMCLTYTMKLEAWDVGGECEAPRLDWAVQLENRPVHRSLDWVRKVRYLAYADQTGDLFVVVRHFNHHIKFDTYNYEDPTVYFEVYKVDKIDRGCTKMESLEGMTLFVGMNDAIAIKLGYCGGEGGVQRDSIYFTYDERIGGNTYIGIFDYKYRVPYPSFSISLPDKFLHAYDRVDYPLWFAPRHTATV